MAKNPERKAKTGRRTILEQPGAATLANVADTLRAEHIGAALLLVATVAAVVWANSPWAASYLSFAQTPLGPARLHLDLTVSQWAKDGLLAIFFFVVGLELKREIVTGQLRRPATAVVPVVAAVGGMAVPAGLYALVNLLSNANTIDGWAIPVATDIAFAMAVLSVFGRSLPSALRAFLLTLAVADDLLGIVVIAIFYASSLNWFYLAAAVGAIVAFGLVVRLRRPPTWLLLVLALVAWYTMHASGIHATIAGVALGFMAPAVALPHQAPRKNSQSLAERYEHLWRPVSAGLAVPVFAFFAAGVRLAPNDLAAAVADPAAQGVALGLVVGKPVGILVTTFLLVSISRAQLDRQVRWADLAAVGCLAGIGFTVSLLIGELAFDQTSAHLANVKAAVLVGSLTSAVVGGVALRWRSARHRLLVTNLESQSEPTS